MIANIAALAAIADAPLADGAEVEVATLGQIWKLAKTDVATVADGITVIASADGKRWKRVLSSVPRWTNQTAWYVNYATGDDEFTGTSATVDGGGVGPLKTVAEFTRRVRVAKYGTGFAGYVLNLSANDVGLYDAGAAAYRDSFQWDFSLETTKGLVNQDQDSGITRSILQINGVKTDAGNDGTVKIAGTSITFGNAKSKIQRNAGSSFAVGEVIEITQAGSPALGKRAYVLAVETTDTADDTAIINPWTFQGALPADNDTFKTYTLTKWGPQISGYGTQGQHRIQIDNVELPGLATPGAPDGVPAVLAEGDGCPDYELGGFVVRFRNTLSRISITGGIGGRVRWGHNNTNPVAIIKPALIAAPGTLQNSFMTIERGDVVANYVSFVNCIVDVMNIRGILTLSRSCILNGCIRMGLKGAGSVSQTQAGPTFVRLDRVTVWDVPTTVGANPFVGGDGDPGAALIMKRGSGAQVRGLFGDSINATTVGIDISEGSSLWLQDFGVTPSTVTGALHNLKVDNGDDIPVIVAGVPTAPAPGGVTSWAGLAGYGEVAMNLRNGTRIVKVA